MKKSCIRETSNLSTDADRRTDTILERLRDLSKRRRKKEKKIYLPPFFFLNHRDILPYFGFVLWLCVAWPPNPYPKLGKLYPMWVFTISKRGYLTRVGNNFGQLCNS